MSGRGTVLGGRYTLTERIGGGGMGAVWRAEDAVLGRPVAVKILHPALLADVTFAERFRREARMLALLDHVGIVDVHDYGEEEPPDADGDRLAYLVMELVDGWPLDRVLAADGALPPARALGLLAEALDALHAAHRRGIVHRDVKPSNLMLRADGRVTVTDFGIARSMAGTRLTASHAVVGTALYMAPEQAEGKAVTPAVDLYAIGVVCYELLVGRPPFTGGGMLEVALKHLREPAPELPGDIPRRCARSSRRRWRRTRGIGSPTRPRWRRRPGRRRAAKARRRSRQRRSRSPPSRRPPPWNLSPLWFLWRARSRPGGCAGVASWCRWSCRS